MQPDKHAAMLILVCFNLPRYQFVGVTESSEESECNNNKV